jgi:hypothetical protein
VCGVCVCARKREAVSEHEPRTSYGCYISCHVGSLIEFENHRTGCQNAPITCSLCGKLRRPELPCEACGYIDGVHVRCDDR